MSFKALLLAPIHTACSSAKAVALYSVDVGSSSGVLPVVRSSVHCHGLFSSWMENQWVVSARENENSNSCSRITAGGGSLRN